MLSSKEALEELVSIYNGIQYGIQYDVEDIIELMDIIKQDLERLEVLEQKDKKWQELFGRDLCEVLGNELLRQENEKLKKENQQLLVNKNVAQALAIKYKKAIEILKDIFDIYAGDGKGYIDCCVENPIITFDLYNDTQFKEYELLKEVMNNE